MPFEPLKDRLLSNEAPLVLAGPIMRGHSPSTGSRSSRRVRPRPPT